MAGASQDRSVPGAPGGNMTHGEGLQGHGSEINRTMSIEMADVSGLSIQADPQMRQGSADEDRMREKAREAHEQVQVFVICWLT